MADVGPSDYFERRFEEERAAARIAVDRRAARSHLELAKRYQMLATDRKETVASE